MDALQSYIIITNATKTAAAATATAKATMMTTTTTKAIISSEIFSYIMRHIYRKSVDTKNYY